MGYLDNNGLSRLIDKTKTALSEKANGVIYNHIQYEVDENGYVDIGTGGGGGDAKAAICKVDATIAPAAWTLVGSVYTYRVTGNDSIQAGMLAVEAWLADEDARLGETSYTVVASTSGEGYDLLVSTTVLPTAQWVLSVVLAMDGAEVIEEITSVTQKVGTATLTTTAQNLSSAVNELNSNKLNSIRYNNSKIQQSKDGETYTDVMAVDTVPTDNSTNPVSSNGVYDALRQQSDQIAELGTPVSFLDNCIWSITPESGLSFAYSIGKLCVFSIMMRTPSPVTSDCLICTLPFQVNGVFASAICKAWDGAVCGLIRAYQNRIYLVSDQWTPDVRVSVNIVFLKQ